MKLIKRLFRKLKDKLGRAMDKLLGGHITIGNLTVYGRNAMHWGVNYWTKRWGYVCFRLPFRCYGCWLPLYFYVSPNATPWAATFMMGRKYSPKNWALSRVRRERLGHRWDTNSDDNHRILREINNSL